MGHVFSSLTAETTKLPILAFEALPGYLSSKELKDLPLILRGNILKACLASNKKINTIQSKREGKAEQKPCILLSFKTIQKMSLRTSSLITTQKVLFDSL